MKKTSKFISIVSISLTGLALSVGALSGVFKNRAVETEALFTPSTTYNVSDTQEELASYYSSIGSGDTGDTLLGKLRSLNSSKYHKNFSYSNFGTSSSTSPYVYTDYPLGTTTTDSNGQVRGSAIASFYTKTTSTSYNKEHVWPDSKGGNKVENDILMPRPTISSENSSRGNSNFIEGKNSSSAGWDPYTAGYDIACRGECARIMLYCVVASSQLSLTTGTGSSSSSCGDMNTLIKWHFDYSPSTYEMNRNNGAEYLQGNRNPFVDHPEYVAKIWSNFNSTVTSICNNKSSMYNEWVPGSCSNYGTNDAAGIPDTGSGEGGEGGEQGGGEQGGGTVGDVVTSNSQVANGDKVVLCTQEANPKGVTGRNGTKDAGVSFTESEWKEYTVGSATSSGFTLKDEEDNQYIASPTDNEFKYSSNAGTCSVDSEGRLMCNSRYLCMNGTNYRFYKSYGSYTPFFVYLKSSSSGGGGGGEQQEVTSITASVSKTYYVGDTINNSDIHVKNNLNQDVTVFSFANDGYKFTYEDAASGGALTNKTFTNAITYSSFACSLTVQVQRKAYAPTSSTSLEHTGAEFKTAGIVTSYEENQTVKVDGITFKVDGYVYNNTKLSLSDGKTYAPGKVINTTPYPSGIIDVTINGATPDVQLSTDGSIWIDLDAAQTSTNDYYYLKIYYSNTAQTNFVNITSFVVSLKGAETLENVANYIMYEDTNNQCVSKLETAIGYLHNLSSTDRDTFSTSEEYVVATARERLEAWALNQGKTINYDAGTLNNKSSLVSFKNENNDTSMAIIIAVTSLSVISLSVLLIIKKKRLHN